MSLNTFFHDPAWSKVYGSLAVGSCGILGLIALRIKIMRARKRDIYQSALLIAETHGANTETEASIDAASNAAREQPMYAGPSRIGPLSSAAVVVACITVTALTCIFALRNYTILNNWQEGNDRTFIGDYVGAILCYKKALRVDPSLKRTHLLIGIALLKSDKSRSAIPELRVAAYGEKLDPEPAAVLGDALMILNRPTEAVDAYKQAINIAERTPNGISVARTPDYYVALAGALERLRRLDEAYRAYQKAIEVDHRCARAHIKIGELLLSTGHFDEAMAHCKKAAEVAQYDPIAHNTLAAAFARIGNYNAAVEEYKRSTELDPHGAVAFYDLGALLERRRDYPRSLEAFRTAAKLSPRNRAEMEATRRAQGELNRIRRSNTK